MGIRVAATILITVFTIAASPSLAQEKGALCQRGQAVGPHTKGHCCWPGQVWEEGPGCVGAPTACPEGTVASGEGCARKLAEHGDGPSVLERKKSGKKWCPPGEEVGPLTKGHCCLPGQSWHPLKLICAGVPASCPKGQVVDGEQCVTPKVEAPSQPVAATTAATVREEPAVPELPPVQRLEGMDIVNPLRALTAKVKECYAKHKVPGMANVHVVVGWTGVVESAKVGGAFGETPTGECVEAVVRQAKFRRFKASRNQIVTYPYTLP